MRYSKLYNDGFHTMMARKLGLTSLESATDVDLISELQSVLQLRETDMTLFYRALADLAPYDSSSTAELAEERLLAPFEAAYYQTEPPAGDERSRTLNWMRAYVDRVRIDGSGKVEDDGSANEARRQRMNAVNPKYVLRNYLAQLAIDKSAEGDHSMVQELLEVLRRPYDEQPGKEAFAQKRPEWARHRAGCSMLSCSS